MWSTYNTENLDYLDRQQLVDKWHITNVRRNVWRAPSKPGFCGAAMTALEAVLSDIFLFSRLGHMHNGNKTHIQRVEQSH